MSEQRVRLKYPTGLSSLSNFNCHNWEYAPFPNTPTCHIDFISPFFSMAMLLLHTPFSDTHERNNAASSERHHLPFSQNQAPFPAFFPGVMGHWVTENQVPCPMSVSTLTPMPMPRFYFWGSSCLIWFCGIRSITGWWFQSLRKI